MKTTAPECAAQACRSRAENVPKPCRALSCHVTPATSELPYFRDALRGRVGATGPSRAMFKRFGSEAPWCYAVAAHAVAVTGARALRSRRA